MSAKKTDTVLRPYSWFRLGLPHVLCNPFSETTPLLIIGLLRDYGRKHINGTINKEAKKQSPRS